VDGRSARGRPIGVFAASDRNQLLTESSIPLYDQLGRILRRFIEEEQLKQGDRFPTEKAIAAGFGVSRLTANRAVQELISQGWLERERGRGTFVRSQHVVDLSLLSENLSLTEQFPRKAELRTDIITRKAVRPDRKLSRALGLRPDEEVVFLRRLRFVDDCPVMVCDAYLSAERFGDLGKKPLVRGSLYVTLEEEYRLTIERSERRVEGNEVVDSEVAELLRVPLFSPILLLTGLTFVEGETSPIEQMTAYVRERVAFKSTVRRKAGHGDTQSTDETRRREQT
jgi:GntR family transcriptional regulator